MIVLFDTPQTHQSFYPLSLTRPVALLRHGILTLQERWQKATGLQVYTLADEYLKTSAVPDRASYLYIDASFLPSPANLTLLKTFPKESSLFYKERLVAIHTSTKLNYPIVQHLPETTQRLDLDEANFLQYPWQLFQTNTKAIEADYNLLTTNRISQPVDSSNIVTGGTAIFIEEGATVKGCFINASEGPVYIGKDALVMEGTCIRGPVAICHHAVVKMGAKLYSGTTIGPYCTAGGEIKNAILTGYSNKAHDGYLGDAVVGEWCNMGAGTTNSNMKNTGGEVRMWSEAALDFIAVGKKGGLIMGDYCRSAINTSFNTGTVVGVCSHIIGGLLTTKHIQSFKWGTEDYILEKALEDINRWKLLKGSKLEKEETEMLKHLYKTIINTAFMS
jgi:UDP-N-acetylglucosamine diphosphorylase / glucose-1-phosphate thymidylyltransferase / UDP-N-acetylgalactosamine diphosphorylase / glucosamine-1-phosphate N-acetyltransferase / galactosamine-1-phosphate N-acetyltransferase